MAEPTTSPLRQRRLRVLAILALAVASIVGGCSKPSGDGEGPEVVVSFYPLEYVAARIGGDTVTIENLTPEGADPHNLDLSSKQVAQIGEASLVVYVSGLTPAVDDALDVAEPDREVDTVGVADLDGSDPHFWLDPTRLSQVAEQVADAFAKVDPEHAAGYRERADALATDLARLDRRYSRRLAPCAGDTLVTSHEAFGYLAERYDLHQSGISGIDPEVEPSPARLREVANIVDRTGVQTLFFETRTGPDTTRALAEELGVTTDVLNPIESQTDENDDYLDIMNNNLMALRRGLPCADAL